MKKRNYDNALTLLYNNNDDLNTNILTLENDDLYKEIASVLTELSLIDRNSGKKIISENERILLEAKFLEKLKNAWGRIFGRFGGDKDSLSWSDIQKLPPEEVNKLMANLPPDQQHAIKRTQQKLAAAAKRCFVRNEADWSVKTGTDAKSPEEKKAWIDKMIPMCVRQIMDGEEGKSAIGKLRSFLKDTVPGKIIVTLLAVGAIAYVSGAIGSHTENSIKSIDDGVVKVSDSVEKVNQDLNNSHVVVNADCSTTKVDVGSDGHTLGVVERDHGVTDLKPDQIQKVADNIINTIKDINKDPDLGGKQVKSVTLKFHSDKSNTNGDVDADKDGIMDSNDCNGGPCAETHNKKTVDAVMKIVNQTLQKDGVTTKVNIKSSIGGLADNQVSKNSVEAKSQQGTTVTLDGIDAPVKSVKDSNFKFGPLGPVAANPLAPKTKSCYFSINGKKVYVGNGDLFVDFYGKIESKKIKSKENTYDGIITNGDTKLDLRVLGGFSVDEKQESTLKTGQYIVVRVVKMNGEEVKNGKEFIMSCGMESSGKIKKNEEPNKPTGEDIPKKPNEDEKPKKGEEEPETEIGGERIPANFLKGNRNMQLAYLASNFLPQKDTFFNKLNLKEGTVIPSGFLDAALGQGSGYKSLNSKNYLKAYYNKLKKDNSFIKNIDVNTWLKLVKSPENQNLIKWVRNTRKSIGPFIQKLRKAFPEFKIGERQKAKVEKPGEEGQAMALAGESLNGRYDLILEVDLNSIIKLDSFNKNQFMKNLPQFMKMLSMMYYGAKGKPLSYDKKAVLKSCKKFGCKEGGANIKYKKTKSGSYKFQKPKKEDNMSESLKNQNPLLIEEVNKIKNLMSRIL